MIRFLFTLALVAAALSGPGCAATDLTERSQPVEYLVAYQDLPAGLVVHRSWGRIDLGIDGGPAAGAYLRTADSSAWYCTDWTGGMADPEPWLGAVYFGPFASLASCKAQLQGHIVYYLDTEGTDGASDWLELP
jgi:hypothetical protein